MKFNKLRLLTYGIILYMSLAFTWWAVLLYIKNKDAYQAKIEYNRLINIANNNYTDEESFLLDPAQGSLKKEYNRQTYMILGEAMVFMFILVAGIREINRGYKNQVEAAKQQRNFLLSITHELKSPIASIKLALQTILKRDLDKPKLHKLAEAAVEENDRLHQLVNNLLFSAKLEKSYTPTFESAHIDELLSDCIVNIQKIHPESKIVLEKEVSNTELELDKEGMDIVFRNLIENSIKYSESHNLNILLDETADRINIQFKDQGIGINEEDKKRVFNKFYRVGSEETRKTKGTGLGLYIVKQIIKAHNGEITIKDNHPQGSIFEISLSKN